MSRILCLTCENTGVVIEYRLAWKEFREGHGLVACSDLAESEANARAKLRALPDTAVEAEVLSGARNCPVCRPRVAAPVVVAAEAETPADQWWMRS